MRTPTLHRAVLLALLPTALAACGSPTSVTDGGHGSDGSTLDAFGSDSSGGGTDGGSLDAGNRDSGSSTDSGARDGSSPGDGPIVNDSETSGDGANPGDGSATSDAGDAGNGGDGGTTSCPTGFSDCDNDPSNGCETQVVSDAANCGSCGHVCTPPANATPSCASSACDFTCNPGYHRCGDHCASDTDASQCGATCAACATPANGAAVCASGACGVACNSGYHACGGACASDTDPNQCGGACTACPAPTGGTAACTGGACQQVCPSSAPTNCSGACADLSSDVNHCGTCSNACTLIRGCTASACTWQAVMDAINRARSTSQNCGGTIKPAAPALAYDSRIENAALYYAQDAAARNLDLPMLNGTGSNGTTPYQRVRNNGYPATTASWIDGVSSGDTPDTLVSQLIADPSLCSVIMTGTYGHFGFAAAPGSLYPIYFEMIFTTP